MSTVRISESTNSALHFLARETGFPMGVVVDRAVEDFRRRYMLMGASEDYAKLKADSKEWAAVEAQRAEWDVTLADGLEHE